MKSAKSVMKISVVVLIIAAIMILIPILMGCETCDDPAMKSKIEMLTAIQIILFISGVLYVFFSYRKAKLGEAKNGSD